MARRRAASKVLALNAKFLLANTLSVPPKGPTERTRIGLSIPLNRAAVCSRAIRLSISVLVSGCFGILYYPFIVY